MPRIRRGAGLLSALLLVAACGGSGPSTPPASSVGAPASSGASAACPTSPAPDPAALSDWGLPTTAPTLTPLLISNYIVCGEARILFLFLDGDQQDVSAPDRRASVAFYDLGTDPATPVTTVDGEFIWTIQDERGMYIANVTLPSAGQWGVEFTTEAPGSPAERTRVTFEVHDDSPWVAVGEKAPASDSPTVADVDGDLARLSTDQEPDPAFYQTSVADALAAHEPFVLVFATPAFCATAQCGPTLIPIGQPRPAAAFIFEGAVLDADERPLEPGELVAVNDR